MIQIANASWSTSTYKYSKLLEYTGAFYTSSVVYFSFIAMGTSLLSNSEELLIFPFNFLFIIK